MSTAAQRSARGALDAARPALGRLDASRGSEDLAADLIELWMATEAGLRSLVGTSTLTGQPLIREARQRQLIDFGLANSLAEFQAVHDRLQNTSYRPTSTDVDAARSAFTKLDTALMGDTGVEPPVIGSRGPQPSAAPAPAVVVAEGAAAPVGTRRRVYPLWLVASIAVVVIALAVGAYFVFHHGSSGSLQQGIDAYKAGQREVAVSAFTRATHEDPKDPTPHIYLARMSREVGNFTQASQELQLALEADPSNAIALREMGANLLAQGNYELARRFYVRAVQADPTDKMSQGYLGCVLVRLNRQSDAANFLTRAGPGPWSNCTPAAAGTLAPPTGNPPLTTNP
ncbi:MAG TPA: tetratricopeptide repeat protein [Gemmatimonadaceae bacterium]|nr:tetratricopeptide repeat protein [Gemmatimonadaceae bacterium]